MQLVRRLHKRTLGRRVQAPSVQPAPVDIAPNQARVFQAMLRGRVAGRRGTIRHQPNDVAQGRLTFLGTTATLGDPFQWERVGQLEVDHLWRFHAHYQEYLLDLAAEPSDARAEKIWSIVGGWIDAHPSPNPRSTSDAWHPFCISRRLPIWMMMWHAAPPAESKQRAVLASMLAQVTYLAENLELDPGGNHLLENLRTLVLAGAFLDTPRTDAWLRVAEARLREELPKQILSTGEHFERAPAYHSLVLELLLDIRDAARQSRTELAEFVDHHARSMGAFLKAILHPDDEIPLLSDSAFGAAPRSTVLLDRLELEWETSPATGTGASSVGDYWVWRSEDSMMLFDAGPAAADSLPAHAHCDLLGIEASVFGQRLLVDAGVFDYGATDMRRYCRGTAAHNTLQVDDADQFDVWSRFRMGYRGHPSALKTGESAGFHWAQSTHNAYRRLGVETIGRWIGCRLSVWVGVDWALGEGQHRTVNRLRVHPDFEIQAGNEPGHYQLTYRSQTIHLRWLVPDPMADFSVEEGWYCPEFGVRQSIRVLTCSMHQSLPSWSSWVVSLQTSNPEVAVDVHGSDASVTYIPTDETVNVCLGTPES